MILLVFSEEQWIEAYAVEGTALPALRLEPAKQQKLYAAVYDSSLADLRLLPGKLERGQQGVEPERPDRAYSMVVGTGEWTETEVEPEVFDELRISPAPATCGDVGRYARTEKAIEGSEVAGPCFAAPTNEGAFVGNNNGVWYVERNTNDGSIHLTIPSPEPIPHFAVTATTTILAISRFQEAYLVVQRGGGLSIGRFSAQDGFYRVGVLPGALPAKAAWIAGSPPFTPSAPEAYILDSRGGLWWLSRDGLLTVRAPDPDPNHDFGENGGLLWVSSGSAYAIGPMGGGLWRISDTNLDQELLPQDAHPVSLAYSGSLGVMAGDLEGRVWVSVDQEWTQLDTPAMPPVEVIVPFDQGILYGGRQGALAYYRPNWPCHEGFTAASRVFGVSIGRSPGFVQLMSSSGISGDAGPIIVTSFRR